MSIVIYKKNDNGYNVSMETKFADWLQKKYIDWLAQQGEIKSQREFADFLEIDKVSLSRYLNGRIKNPDSETIESFAKKLGPEIYDILGLARPDPQLQELTSIWHKLDDQTKDKIIKLAKSSI